MDLKIPMMLGGEHRDLIGKIKKGLTYYGQMLFKIFAYNAQRFGDLGRY